MSNTEPITLFDAQGNAIQVPASALQPQESNSVRQMREHIQQLETQLAEKAQIEDENRQLQRGMALQSAGLTLDETKLKAFEAAHSGEWNKDAVTQTAVALGWAAPPAPTTPPGEIDTHQQMSAAFSGAITTPPDEEAVFDQRLQQATNEADFMALYRQSARPIAP